MKLSRRPVFFGVLVVVCLLLIPATPADLRWVNMASAGLALFWAVLLAIEELAAQRRNRRNLDPREAS